MLYYLPLEPYIERYTYLMSCKDGWAESHFKTLGVDFMRVTGEQLNSSIKDGVVLDACGRSYYAMSQMMKVVKLINDNVITDDDIIYVEDFWHPGIESLFYIRHLKNMKFRVGTFIHAQSVDDTDFSYSMRDWMRFIEQGYGKQYDYIFTCSEILRDLCIKNKIASSDNIFYVGLPYNSNCLKRQLLKMGFEMPEKKKNTVIFSSRFDDEKDPMFFLDLVESCSDISFILVNPRTDRSITSNTEVLERLKKIVKKADSNLSIVDTSNKVKYYKALAEAEIQFNCAHQDWVSWTLLEACTFNCKPLYPKWKDFPLELNYNENFLYEKRNLNDCITKLRNLLDMSFDKSLNAIVEKHDNSWKKYLTIMGEVK